MFSKDLPTQKDENTQKPLPKDRQVSINNDSIVPDVEGISVTGIEKNTPTKKSEQNSVPEKRRLKS